ncbi:MAG: DUF1320 family protein [Bacteroidetes bacterium]|nr:DUF1320 family protein [Bacteroidota bacterium]
MPFLTNNDYKAVSDAATLEVLHQSDQANLQRAETYALEEICSYLRAKYDMTAAFSATGAERNPQLVMIAADIALYHLVAWLPKRMGFEMREIRYKRAIEWLEAVQAGRATPNLPPLIQPTTANPQNGIRYGSWKPATHQY